MGWPFSITRIVSQSNQLHTQSFSLLLYHLWLCELLSTCANPWTVMAMGWLSNGSVKTV